MAFPGAGAKVRGSGLAAYAGAGMAQARSATNSQRGLDPARAVIALGHDYSFSRADGPSGVAH
jgi:hypothetical protein